MLIYLVLQNKIDRKNQDKTHKNLVIATVHCIEESPKHALPPILQKK